MTVPESEIRPATLARQRGERPKRDPKPETQKARGRLVRISAFGLVCVSLFAGIPRVFSAEAPTTAASLDTRFFQFAITAATGHCQILDKETKTSLGWAEPDAPFGTIAIKASGKTSWLPLNRCSLSNPNRKSGLVATFHPVAENPDAAVRIHFQLLSPRTLELSYEADPGLEIESISPLANVLAATGSGKGYVLIPVREGLLIPPIAGSNSNIVLTPPPTKAATWK